ncbi:hypothetical protein HBI26_010350 [Parastagonospora nodorum]|nr:hypothetical protein HBI26_010350 [Parastagonospora nodorum]
MTGHAQKKPGRMKRLLQRLITPVHRKLSSFLETPTPNVEVLPESLWLANNSIPEQQHATFYDHPMAHSYEDAYNENSRMLVQKSTSSAGQLHPPFSGAVRPKNPRPEQGAAFGILDRRPRRQPVQPSEALPLHENLKSAFCRSDSRGGITIRSLLSLGSLREPDTLRNSNSIVGMMEDQRHAAKEMKGKFLPASMLEPSATDRDVSRDKYCVSN